MFNYNNIQGEVGDVYIFRVSFRFFSFLSVSVLFRSRLTPDSRTIKVIFTIIPFSLSLERTLTLRHTHARTHFQSLFFSSCDRRCKISWPRRAEIEKFDRRYGTRDETEFRLKSYS